PRIQEFIRARIFAAQALQFISSEGAALVIYPSEGDGGTIFVDGAVVPKDLDMSSPLAAVRSLFFGEPQPYDPNVSPIVPQVVLSAEQYNRLARMIQAGEKLQMKIALDVQFSNPDLMAYNTVAEIPGTDKADELVMVGGHMDSWHSGTGATDNGAGVAAAMEAVRILKALNLKPRRTIRIALWTGEEQGLRGSRAYVMEHFGGNPPAFGTGRTGAGWWSSRPLKPGHEKFSAYFNLDNGTGKIRGVYLQGNEAVRPIFRQWLQPFRDMGATTLSLSNTGGTDHQSFDGVGLP